MSSSNLFAFARENQCQFYKHEMCSQFSLQQVLRIVLFLWEEQSFSLVECKINIFMQQWTLPSIQSNILYDKLSPLLIALSWKTGHVSNGV